MASLFNQSLAMGHRGRMRPWQGHFLHLRPITEWVDSGRLSIDSTPWSWATSPFLKENLGGTSWWSSQNPPASSPQPVTDKGRRISTPTSSSLGIGINFISQGWDTCHTVSRIFPQLSWALVAQSDNQLDSTPLTGFLPLSISLPHSSPMLPK